MSKNSSKGKEAAHENEETSKDLFCMKEAMKSARELIKNGTQTEGTKTYRERRGILMGSTRNDCESSKNKGGKENGSSTVSKIATVAAGAAVAVTLVGGFIGLLSGSGSNPDPEPEKKRKTMVAPGQGYRIYRDEFENSPKEKFRGWREEKKKNKLNGRK